MKIRNLLAIVAMLSLFVFGIGTAYAVIGVADDVPANSLVLPIICGKDAANGLNTQFSIAEKECAPVLDPVVTVTDGNAVMRAHFSVRNSCSDEVYTFDHYWTCKDVEDFSCKTIVSNMPATAKTKMEFVVDGVTYYAGYIIVDNITDSANNLLGWAYLVDLNLGFASALNIVGLENGFGTRLEEAAGSGPITAETIFPRYFILNDKPNTYNWWIILAGRNQLGNVTCGAITYTNGCSQLSLSRSLTGVICNMEEDCPDLDFGIPRELNIIDVEPELPAIIHAGYPKGGFAILSIVESGNLGTSTVNITGTRVTNTGCTLNLGDYYSLFGWSYQREEANVNAPSLSWDVISPMHRVYCSVPEGLSYILGTDCTATVTP